MNSPMTWGDYVTIEILIPGAVIVVVTVILFAKLAYRIVKERREADALLNGDHE